MNKYGAGLRYRQGMTSDTARSPRLLRQMNSGALLRFALGTGEFTAAEAMAATGLTRATVLGLCDDLTGAGWLEEIADSRAAGLTSRGRPARRHRLREKAGVVVGVDAGEGHLEAVVADLRGATVATRRQEVGYRPLDVAGRRQAVRALIDEALGEAAPAVTRPLITVVGVPAPVDASGSSPSGLRGYWALMNPGFTGELGGLVEVENDANLAALAEHAHAPADDVATLLTGERFGAGIILDGRLLHGARGGAGELRFLDLLAGDDPDAGATDGLGALTRRWSRAEVGRGRAVPGSILHSIGAEQIGAEDVFRAAGEGDRLALEILERLGGRLAHVAVVLASVLDVERIVLAGGMAPVIEPVLEAARRVLATDFYPPVPQLVASDLGRTVVVQGAVVHALRRIAAQPHDFIPAPAAADRD